MWVVPMINGRGGYLRLTPSVPLLVLLVSVSTAGGGVLVFSRAASFATTRTASFGVKFKYPAAADDLVRCLQLYYTLTVKENTTKFLGLTIAVDPIARNKVRLSTLVSSPRLFNGSPYTPPPSPALPPSISLLASELPLRLLTISTPLLCLLLKNITAYRCSAEFCYTIASPP